MSSPSFPFFLWLVLFNVLFCCPKAESTSSCGPWNEEREILVSFYAATSGCSWKNSTLWLSAFSDHCQWYGIACDTNSHVISIGLSSNGLSGTLPPFLDKLKYLETMDLSANRLTGEVSASLGEISNIKVIDLSRNSFNTIPQNFQFGMNSSIEELNFSDNELSEIPSTLLTTLPQSFQSLKVSKNHLSELPSSLGLLKNLRSLDLSWNNLRLPEAIWSLTALEELWLNSIGMRSLSSEIGDLQNLRILDISMNKLTSTPSEMEALRMLEYLNLGNNLFNEVPAFVDTLKQLQRLEIAINNISNMITLHSSTLGFLTTSTNPFPEIDLTFLSNLTTLQTSANTIVSSVIPSSIQALTFYESTDLQLPQLSPNIVDFQIWGVSLEEWPSTLWSTELSALKTFVVAVPPSSLPFPSWLQQAPSLEILRIQNIKGTLSSEIGRFTNLKELLISDSPELNGTLPTEIGSLTNLERLSIINCRNLSGSVPKELALLQNLSVLIIQNTNFGGTLADELKSLNQIGNCTFGNSGNHALTCEAQSLMNDHVCDIKCEGQSLFGVWRYQANGCQKIDDPGWVGLGGADLIINTDNSFLLSTNFLLRCAEPFYVTVSGQMEVIDQIQVEEDLYRVDLSFTLETKDMLALTQTLIGPFSAICGFSLVAGEVIDISGLNCHLLLTIVELVSVSGCPTTNITVLVDFKHRSLWSDHLSLASVPCSRVENDTYSYLWNQGGWNCTTSVTPWECEPICGDQQVLDVEQCDDGNTQNNDGCNQHCIIEPGWNCMNSEYQKSICTPICGDGIAVSVQDCDLHGNVSQTNFSAGFIVLVVVGSVLIICGILFALLYQRRKKVHGFEIQENELELGEVLGEGKFGKVHKGTWRKTTTVAVKVLKNVDLEESKLKEFIDEARLFSQLPPHPNIVQFLGITLPADSKKRRARMSMENEDTFPKARIITEFLGNGNLINWFKGSIIDDPYLAIELNLQLAKGISAGMDHLHKNKIIHRDLAARNVLIHTTVNERTSIHTGSTTKAVKIQVIPKISDFGLSGTVKKNSLVAIRWAAPEILKGGAQKSTEKSDVWAFGVLLYEILVCCSHPPFMDLSNDQVVERVLSGKVLEPPPDCHVMFSDVMRSCLNASIHLRPSFENVFQTLTFEESQLERDVDMTKETSSPETKERINDLYNQSIETNYMAVSSDYA